MVNSRKKIIARLLNGEWLAGYGASEALSKGASIQLLDLEGRIVEVEHERLKWVCLVRDFNSGEIANPERLIRKKFVGRPRGHGVWVRAMLQDGDELEGLAENNLTLIAGPGILLAPPDVRSNTQRIWLPRCALARFEIAAVLGDKRRRTTDLAIPLLTENAQERLFPDHCSEGGTIQSLL